MTASRRERPPGPLPRVGPDPPRRKGRMYPPPTGGGRPRSPSQERRPLDPPPPPGGNPAGAPQPRAPRGARPGAPPRAGRGGVALRLEAAPVDLAGAASANLVRVARRDVADVRGEPVARVERG